MRNSERTPEMGRGYVIGTIVVTPLVFAVTVLLALPVGAANAVVIALPPTLFAGVFLGGLVLLSRAIERSEPDAAVLTLAPGRDSSPAGLRGTPSKAA